MAAAERVGGGAGGREGRRALGECFVSFSVIAVQ